MRPVFWSDEARRDLLAVVGYIAQDNPEAASRVGDRILETAETLGQFATGHQGRVSGTHEKQVTGLPYTISYAIDKLRGKSETIVILRVIHDARHWPSEIWPE